MSDRRVGDRREGGSKKITVSLSTFVFSILIAVIVFASIVICFVSTKKAYNNGYSQALTDVSSSSEYYDGQLEEITDTDFSATGTSEINEVELTNNASSTVTSQNEQ